MKRQHAAGASKHACMLVRAGEQQQPGPQTKCSAASSSQSFHHCQAIFPHPPPSWFLHSFPLVSLIKSRLHPSSSSFSLPALPACTLACAHSHAHTPTTHTNLREEFHSEITNGDSFLHWERQSAPQSAILTHTKIWMEAGWFGRQCLNVAKHVGSF